MNANDIVKRVLNEIPDIDDAIVSTIKNALYIVLNDYAFSLKNCDLAPIYNDEKSKAINMFFVTKKVEGCTDDTLRYYQTVLNTFFRKITYSLNEITADTIRYYIATRSMNDGLSKTSQDNELRVLKSFFNWCSSEGYIDKPPTMNMKPIKQEKRLKKPLSEREIEVLRDATKNIRDKALVDVLYSTGVRCSELIGMNRSDIENDEIIVFGKGEKERIVYLNTRAKLSLDEYLKTRTDNNDALFVSLKKPFTRIGKSCIEGTLKKLGCSVNISNVHPHRFRRTAATIALNRGMPIEQVSQMLGHSKIETTTIYARSSNENVKSSHKKYVV